MPPDPLLPPRSPYPVPPQAIPPTRRQRELLHELLLLISTEKHSLAQRVIRTQALLQASKHRNTDLAEA